MPLNYLFTGVFYFWQGVADVRIFFYFVFLFFVFTIIIIFTEMAVLMFRNVFYGETSE